jgi:hypothetical protein
MQLIYLQEEFKHHKRVLLRKLNGFEIWSRAREQLLAPKVGGTFSPLSRTIFRI